MRNTIAEITQKLWTPAKLLHQEGLSFHTYLTELTWLLFLKIAPALGKASLLPTHFSWLTLISKLDREQYEYYQRFLNEMSVVNDPNIAGIYADAETSFENHKQLAQVISALAIIDGLPSEEFGAVYESLLQSCAYEKDNLLYIVPRPLVDIMVVLTQPQRGESIQDPFAGTAGFMITADQYIKVTSDDFFDTDIKPHTIIAIEPDLVRLRFALMNCLLHGVGHSQYIPVRWGDSLLSKIEKWPPADVIFSMLLVHDSIDDDLDKDERCLALLQHIYQILKPGGRAAVVLPDNILNAAGYAQELRHTLLETCVVHTVLRLPQGVFYPHKVQAHVIFFQKGKTEEEKTEKVWFFDARTKWPILGEYLHLTREHLRPFEMVYGDDYLGKSPRIDEGEQGNWRCFSRDYLAKQGDRLDLCWLENEERRKTVNDEISALLEDTVSDLEALTLLLEEELE
jgi:type I restriction enzyme M protein